MRRTDSTLPFSNSEEIVHLEMKKKPTPSSVYDVYWYFACERQNIFSKRLNQYEFPWTTDPILANYKFTNVYRMTDRVSQYLISNVICNGGQSMNDLFFRIMLYKLFNRISTWQFLERSLGVISYENYSFDVYDKILSGLLESKTPIYSAAYIMASGRSNFQYEKKHHTFNSSMPNGKFHTTSCSTLFQKED